MSRRLFARLLLSLALLAAAWPTLGMASSAAVRAGEVAADVHAHHAQLLQCEGQPADLCAEPAVPGCEHAGNVPCDCASCMDCAHGIAAVILTDAPPTPGIDPGRSWPARAATAQPGHPRPELIPPIA